VIVTTDAIGQAGDPDLGGGRPVVGISIYCEQARWGPWDTPTLLLPRRYAASVSAAGGIPVLLPSFPGIEQLVDRLDALVLSGGGDVNPAEFGADPDPAVIGVRPERDAAEFALAAAALRRGLPFLGVCRGAQVLNVVLGGTLHQHLPALTGHTGHAPLRGAYGSHQVRVAPGSRLAAVLDGPANEGWFGVPTYHHQAVDQLGRGLVATAWAEDGMIEAVEPDGSADAPGGPFTLGVQWHPESGDDPRLFGALIAAAKSLTGAAA